MPRAPEHAAAQRLPIVVACRTGDARMQEGTMSLMQMAKVSVAVGAHRRAALPFVSVLEDPTYGSVSASRDAGRRARARAAERRASASRAPT